MVGEDCLSLWRTLNNEYICDDRYRPTGEKYFVDVTVLFEKRVTVTFLRQTIGKNVKTNILRKI